MSKTKSKDDFPELAIVEAELEKLKRSEADEGQRENYDSVIHGMKEAWRYICFYEQDNHPAYDRGFLATMVYGSLRGILRSFSGLPREHLSKVWARKHFSKFLKIMGRDNAYDNRLAEGKSKDNWHEHVRKFLMELVKGDGFYERLPKKHPMRIWACEQYEILKESFDAE